MNEIFSNTVRIPTYSGNLFGTLAYQHAQNRNIAVLLLADKGAIDRDGNSAEGHLRSYCLRHLAIQLAQFGIASLRYDKRCIGFGDAPELHADELTFEDNVEDAIHSIHFLRETLGYQRVIVVGHGEGALVAALAAQHATMEGLVCLGANARNASALLFDQLRRYLSPEDLSLAHSIIKQLRGGTMIDAVPERFESLFNPSTQRFMISLFQHEPVQAFAKVQAPMLLLHGTRDLQVPYTDANLIKQRIPHATLLYIEGMNHVLKEVKDNNDIQTHYYQDPAINISKALVINIMSFISKLLQQNNNAHKKTLAAR